MQLFGKRDALSMQHARKTKSVGDEIISLSLRPLRTAINAKLKLSVDM